MRHAEIHRDLARVRADFAALATSAAPERLRARTRGTRWTNRQMLFHLVFGYLVTRTLLWLVRLFGRLPWGFNRGFAAVLNAGTRPFHLVNYVGSVIGGTVVPPRLMRWLMDRSCVRLGRRLERTGEAELARVMAFPTRWDPFFKPRMTLLDTFDYPARHYDFHRAQLTL